jgi:hypothetical protein
VRGYDTTHGMFSEHTVNISEYQCNWRLRPETKGFKPMVITEMKRNRSITRLHIGVETVLTNYIALVIAIN